MVPTVKTTMINGKSGVGEPPQKHEPIPLPDFSEPLSPTVRRASSQTKFSQAIPDFAEKTKKVVARSFRVTSNVIRQPIVESQIFLVPSEVNFLDREHQEFLREDSPKFQNVDHKNFFLSLCKEIVSKSEKHCITSITYDLPTKPKAIVAESLMLIYRVVESDKKIKQKFLKILCRLNLQEQDVVNLLHRMCEMDHGLDLARELVPLLPEQLKSKDTFFHFIRKLTSLRLENLKNSTAEKWRSTNLLNLLINHCAKNSKEMEKYAQSIFSKMEDTLKKYGKESDLKDYDLKSACESSPKLFAALVEEITLQIFQIDVPSFAKRVLSDRKNALEERLKKMSSDSQVAIEKLYNDYQGFKIALLNDFFFLRFLNPKISGKAQELWKSSKEMQQVRGKIYSQVVVFLQKIANDATYDEDMEVLNHKINALRAQLIIFLEKSCQ